MYSTTAVLCLSAMHLKILTVNLVFSRTSGKSFLRIPKGLQNSKDGEGNLLIRCTTLIIANPPEISCAIGLNKKSYCFVNNISNLPFSKTILLRSVGAGCFMLSTF